MKAVYFEKAGKEDVLIYGEVPDPKIGPRQVLIRVKAIGINRKELMARERGPAAGAPFFIDGSEVAGIIEDIGSEVTDRRIGQRVVASVPAGGYVELLAVHRAGTVPLPDTLSFEEGASIPNVFLTGWYALVKLARIEPGESVLVQAAGSGVGMAAIQIAKHFGCKVITTAGSGEKVAKARQLGADMAINYQEEDFVPEVMAFTDGHGANVCQECVGGEVLIKSIQALAPLGRLVDVGNASQSPDPPDLIRRLGTKNVLFSRFSMPNAFRAGGVMEELAKIVELCAQGKLKILVDRIFPLEEAAAAHRYLEDRKQFGKLVLVP